MARRGTSDTKQGRAVFGFGITDLVLKNFYCLYLFFFLQSSFISFKLLILDWFYFSWIFNQSIHFFFSIWFFYLFSWLNYFFIFSLFDIINRYCYSYQSWLWVWFEKLKNSRLMGYGLAPLRDWIFFPLKSKPRGFSHSATTQDILFCKLSKTNSQFH